MCNFLAAGPTVAMADTTEDFFDTDTGDAAWESYIAQISYLFTCASLFQGLGNLIWMPLVVKYGRRPIYLASFTLYAITAIWTALAKTYANALVARIVMGLAAGSGECLAPLTISDIFFLHERGTVMAMYTASLNFGVSIGIITSGLVTLSLDWRYIYWIASALIGTLTAVVFFTMPETSYIRRSYAEVEGLHDNKHGHHEHIPTEGLRAQGSYASSLRLFNGRFTSEPLVKLFLRPIMMLALPPVLWATLVMSVTIGFLVAISSNFATAFADTYDFAAWQAGLCFVAGLFGSGFGIFFGGWVSDWIAQQFTKSNGK